MYVTGAAGAQYDSWFQGSKADFDSGTDDSIVINSTGTVSLDRGVQDDFDDNSINTSKWDVSTTGGFPVTEAGGALHINGTVSGSSSSYSKYGRIISDDRVGSFISAKLVSFSGSGTGYRTHIFLLQDTSNYVQIGQIKDSAYGGLVIEWGYTKGGSGSSGSLGAPSSGAHEYKITYSGGTAKVYQDDVQMGSVSITLSNPVFYLICAGKANGDTANATWDNATSGYYSPGMLTSSAHDTLCSPPFITRVDWNDSTTSKSSVTLELRSSDSSDMSSPTTWTQVSKGQTAGLPTAKRYLQYRATLTSTDGTQSPAFLNVTIRYRVSVSKVELSYDNMNTWTTASGTIQWNKWLTLPEGDSTIWVRATDVRGGTDLTSINVTVDSTPPSGSVLIEDDAPFTADPLVDLTLNATDRFGVPEMMISDSPDFAGALWVDYSDWSEFTLTGVDGTKTIYVKFKDGNGLVSNAVSDTIVLDRQAPVGSITINNGAVYANDTQLSLRLNATDTSIVSDMMVSLSPTFAGAEWEPYDVGHSLTLTPGEGERTVFARFRDVLGHVSLAVNDTIILDTLPPQVVVSINNGSVFTNSRLVSIALTTVDASPVEYMQLGEVEDVSSLPIETLRTNLTFLLSAGDGKKTLRARVWDAAGNVGSVGSASIILDTTPPLVEVIIAGGAVYTNERLVTVELRVTDDGIARTTRFGEDPTLSNATEETFTALTSILLSEGDGTKNIYVRITDGAGNVGPIGSDSIILDTTPPTMGLVINDGARFTETRQVTVRLTVVERYATDHIELSEDPSFTNAIQMPFAPTAMWTLSEGDGVKTLFVRAIDLAGNIGETASESIILDTTPPTMEIAINGGAGYTSSGTVELELSMDEQNPTGQFEIDERSSFATAESVEFTAAMTWELSPGDGAKTLYVRTTDLAGNVGQTASASIVLDTTPPRVTISLNGGATYTNGTNVVVALTITETNPTGQAELDEDPAFAHAVIGPSDVPIKWALSSGDGTKTVHVRVRDLAGNVNATASASIHLDTTSPMLTVVVDGGSPFTLDREVTVTLTATDANGVEEMVVVEGADVHGATPVPFEGTFVVTLSAGDGIKTVAVSVKDAVGNWCPAELTTISLDTTPPTTSVIATHDEPESIEVTVSWTSVETTSGVRSYDVQYRDGNGLWENLTLGTNATSTIFNGKRGHTYYFRAMATDIAGNVEGFSDDPAKMASVNIEEPATFLEQPLGLAFLIIIVIAVLVGIGFYVTRMRKRPKGPQENE